MRSCPCEWVIPCSPRCTCAYPSLSGGCKRCCRYGSDKQRMASAKKLAKLLGPSPGDAGAGELERGKAPVSAPFGTLL